MSTTNLFNRIVQETAKLASTPVDSIALSKGRLKRWIDLSAFWEAHSELFRNVFYDAFYHIVMGKHSYGSKPRLCLICLVEEVLLTDAEAVRSWTSQSRAFYRAFEYIKETISQGSRKKRYWNSLIMQEYVLERFRYLLIFRDAPIPQMTLKIAKDSRSMYHFTNQLEVKSVYTRFEEFIELLVPDCRQWSPKQWRSEKFSFSPIQSIHGFDFTDHIEDFDSLAYLYRRKAEGLPYYKTLFSIKSLPDSIAKALWPNGIEKEIIKQFNIACRVSPRLYQNQFRSSDPINPLNMANSWAFQHLTEWRSNRDLVNSNVRSNIMQVALGNHPWVVKARQNGIIGPM